MNKLPVGAQYLAPGNRNEHRNAFRHSGHRGCIRAENIPPLQVGGYRSLVLG